MPTIMLTKSLWRRIGGRGPLPPRQNERDDPGRLRVWSARELIIPEGEFVVALEETTYLTIVCPLLPLPSFFVAFAASLGTQLEVLGIAPDIVQAEANAMVEHPRGAKNDNKSLLGSLNDIAFHALVRFEHESSGDLPTVQKVQSELNHTPHVNRQPCFPDQATRLFFASEGSA